MQAPTPSTATRENHSAYIAVTLFPILILAGGLTGFVFPATFAGLGKWINPALSLIMFGMGLTLVPPDFIIIARRPLPVIIGVISQYAIMPAIGLLIAKMLGLSPELAAGVILVGCCPGGTASNVVTYLARGDVALSVAMTSVSTLLAPLLTPLLTLWLAGTYMPVEGLGMAMSIIQIVLAPVLAGLLVRWIAPALVRKALPVLPWISVIMITVVVMIVVAASAGKIISAGLIVLLAVIFHNGFGLAVGYGVARLAGLPVSARRTTAIEVGMQNSGLAAGLAALYISPLAALPAAVFSVWHNLSGALIAALFRRHS